MNRDIRTARGRRPFLRLPGLAATAASVLLALAACSTGATSLVTRDASGPGGQPAAANPVLDTGSSVGDQHAPGFSLVNQFGQRVSLSQFRGKVVILAFIDSQCTNVCPLTTLSMVEARQLLGAAGGQVQLIGVDANPRSTSVADAMAYSRAHGMVNQWDFLTGSLSRLKTVWRAYRIAVQVEQGQIDHTPGLYVIDQAGRERRVYLTQMSFASVGQSAQILADEVASLLPGHPRVASHRSLAYIPGLGPHAPVTLPRLPSGSVVLAPGRPRLVVFFTSWLAETSDLHARLMALDSYAAAARHGHLPGLVAVDEGSTEPSRGAVTRYLKGLSYPVADDQTGRLADGYGVQDQPWFAVVSAAGKIVWKHDGWLGAAALKAAARKGGTGYRSP